MSVPWEHDCKRCLYNTEPKANACKACAKEMFRESVEALPDGEFKKFCEDNFALIVGEDDDDSVG